MKMRKRDVRKSREDQEDQVSREAQLGYENMGQDEVGGFITPNEPDLINFSKKSVSVDFSVGCIKDESQKYQLQSEGGGVLTPENGTTIDLTVTASSVPMSVDNTDDKNL